jgi:RNA polymerase sigma-70 factor (ECF subfamily)
MLERPLLDRLYRKAGAARWSLPMDAFKDALEVGVQRAFPDTLPARRDLERHLDGLHLADVALACACALGNDGAWEHFITECRPILYRAADALDKTGGAREIADSLYAELYGVTGEGEARRSLFRYFHGRSSLATWVRAVLAQRYIDRLRAGKRTSPLDDAQAAAMPALQTEPDHMHFGQLASSALRAAIADLNAKDRLRLRAYYEQDLTLAEVGRITGEHEATVSRHIARTRKVLKQAVEERLRVHDKLTDAEVANCVSAVMEDAGPLDLAELFGTGGGRKNPAFERSE